MKFISYTLPVALIFFVFTSNIFAQNVGVESLNTNELERAIIELNETIRREPANVSALFLRGYAKFFKQDIDGAILDFSKVIEIAPKMKDIERVYNLRAVAYAFKKNNEKAFADYNTAIAINPEYADPYNGRANIFYERSEFSNSLADYNKTIKLAPGSTAAYLGRADVKFIQGNFDFALADLNKALDLTPNSAEGHIKRGIVYGLKENWVSAIMDLRTGAEINSQSQSPLWGNLQFTLSDLDKYISSHPKEANAFAVRGFINLLRGKSVESAQDFKKSFELNPKLENDLKIFIKSIEETKN